MRRSYNRQGTHKKHMSILTMQKHTYILTAIRYRLFSIAYLIYPFKTYDLNVYQLTSIFRVPFLRLYLNEGTPNSVKNCVVNKTGFEDTLQLPKDNLCQFINRDSSRVKMPAVLNSLLAFLSNPIFMDNLHNSLKPVRLHCFVRQ